MNEHVRALYEAHVAHELAESRAHTFETRVDTLASEVFDWLDDIRLDELITPAQVMGVIERFVIAMRISGGITELAGQMSQTVFRSPVTTETRLDELLPYENYRDYADKVESLQGAQREVLRLITETRAFRALLTRALASSAVLLLAPREDGEQGRAGPFTNARRKLGRELGEKLEERLSRYFEQRALSLARRAAQQAEMLLEPETLRAIADELWDAIGSMRLSALFSFLTVSDLEDFVVLSYETWLTFRKTAFFHETSVQVVDAFFAKYGSESVQALLEDMGVTESMVVDELRILFAPVLALAERTGLRERQIRQRLLRFYESEGLQALLPLQPAPSSSSSSSSGEL